MNRRRTLRWLAAGAAWPLLGHAASAPELSFALQRSLRRVLAGEDHAGRPFALVDKRAALIAVFAADGALGGYSRALLGRAPGDHAVPGAGARAQDGTLRREDCTTPAGRFASQPGRNRHGERIVWFDYEAALAIHRLRPGPEHAERARRLASSDPADKRASAGCVVVPGAFFDGVVQPLLGRGPGVVYVLPEGAAPDPAAL